MGPTTAEMPLKIAVLAIAIPVNSGRPPAQSNAAFGHVDENPPLCPVGVGGQRLGVRRGVGVAGLTSAPKRTAKK